MERRAAIVQLALRSFLAHGYEATTMSAIAKDMGGSKGTLWSYFSSEEVTSIVLCQGEGDADSL